MNGFLPISLTPQQQLACNGSKWKGLTRQQQMGALISIFAKIAGITVNCSTLEVLAAEYNCLPPQAQLPALIYLATQILANGGGGGGGTGDVVLFSSGGLGTPPPFTPTINTTAYPGVTTGAMATDTSTGQQWNYYPGVGWQ